MNLDRFLLDRSWFELSAVACSLPDNVLQLWTDSEAAACLEKGKHGTQESTWGTLWECLDISPGIPKRRNKREKIKRKKQGASKHQQTHKEWCGTMHRERLFWYFLCDLFC